MYRFDPISWIIYEKLKNFIVINLALVLGVKSDLGIKNKWVKLRSKLE